MSASTGWQPLDVGTPLWSFERCDKAGWSLRTIALPLAPAKLLVVSPIRGLPEEAFTGLAALGEPATLFAPNHFHHLGLAEWRARFPGVRVVASEAALPRLRAKSPVPFEPLAALAAALPANVRFLEPPGLKNGEAWVRVQGAGGVVWVVSDAFHHVVEPVRGVEGVLLRALGIVPGLRIGTTFKLLAVRDRRAYREWVLEQLDADRPTALVVGHGEAVKGPALAEQLRALVQSRLG